MNRITALLFLLVSLIDVSAALRAGVAKVDVTRPTARTGDPSYAKALVLSDGKTTAVVVSIDVVAIGEIGIDHYRLPSTRGGSAAEDEAFKAKQVQLFRQQLEVSAELGLNVVIHQRAAFEPCMEVFEPFADRVRGVFHCFVDNPEAAKRVLAHGSIVSFTGVSTFKNAAEVLATMASVPIDKLMLETDAPFLAPVPYRGKRCEPAYVREISEVAAETLGVTWEALSDATCAVARAFFKGLE